MKGLETRSIVSITDKTFVRKLDVVCVESPLSLILKFKGIEHSLGLLMRTPGDDHNLIRGLLYSEGIISVGADINEILTEGDDYIVILSDHINFNPIEHARKLTMTSSCGICGKDSISNLIHMHGPTLSEDMQIDMSLIGTSLTSLQNGQELFTDTGGTHACARLDSIGNLISIGEDVGRHNAMDKLIGGALKNNLVPIREEILIVSGRASFELVQKSLRAGFPIMIALGAPSTLAVDMAMEHGMTLIGFAKENKITVFAGSNRILGQER